MNIKVFSRENCIKYVLENINTKKAIVSITDIKSPFPSELLDAIKANSILFLQFDDEERGDRAMDQDHASTIVEFINSCKEEVDEIVVHCEAGVSRSAAVAGAISFSINGDDAEFFKFPFFPNRHCYRLMLEAFGFDLKQLFLTQKFEANIEEIRKHIDEL